MTLLQLNIRKVLEDRGRRRSYLHTLNRSRSICGCPLEINAVMILPEQQVFALMSHIPCPLCLDICFGDNIQGGEDAQRMASIAAEKARPLGVRMPSLFLCKHSKHGRPLHKMKSGQRRQRWEISVGCLYISR